ncbi:MAG: citrate synthase [Chitinispirillaceae bacterium]|nr:citrate synthase [Chitinispirillaceae bacterium]
MANAELKIGDQAHFLRIVEGTEGEKSIDISTLRSKTGFITLDEGYQNTGSCKSAITFIDGEKGILRYRGYPIEELGAQSSFVEVAYLLIYGELPTGDQLATLTKLIDENSLIHENIQGFFNSLPLNAHPMAVLSSTINILSIYYPVLFSDDNKPETFELMAARLLSTIRTIAAFSYKKSIGEPLVYPTPGLSYPSNFLNMMFSKPNSPHEIDPDVERALEMLLIIHADHEQNCSTSTVRLVGSSRVNLYSSICAGVCALWGPLHGGANQHVIEMLEQIHKQGLSVKECIQLAKDKDNPFRLMGFGHRVYKNFDPRAKMIKEMCKKILANKNIRDPLFEIALELEDAALSDEYFLERKLYPNVDFYSGLIYHAIGIPINMFTVMFSIGRMPGWIAHWKEMHESVPFKIGRPRQIYTGEKERKYIPKNKRKAFSLLDIFKL